MKNIEYLEEFFRKHNLSGKITVRYAGTVEKDDDYMSDIIFEDGNTISINDVIFDIESEFEPYVAEQWMKERKSKDMGLMEWIMTNNTYMPDDVDMKSVYEFQKELQDIINSGEKRINEIFKDVGDSD